MFSKRLLLALVVVLALTLVWVTPGLATAPEQEYEGETITLIFPSHEMDIVGFWPRMAVEFEEKTGAKVELIQMAWEEMAAKVVPAVTTFSDAYDVTELDNGWVAEFGVGGFLEPLDDWMPEGYTDGMVPGHLDLFSWGGKLYGIVWNNDTRFFMYNKKMLEDAGIEAPPKTWDEMLEQCKIMQEKGICEYCLAEPFVETWVACNELHFWTYSFGGEFIDEDYHIIWNDPERGAVEALQFLTDAMKDGIMDPAGVTYRQIDQQDIFLAGEIPFFPQAWPGVYAYAQDPELSQIVGQVGIALVPGKEEGMTAALTLPEAFSIPIKAKNKELSWKLIEFLGSRDVNKRMALEIGALPIYIDMYTDPDLLELYPFWEDFSVQMDTARGLTQVTWYTTFAEVMGVEVQAALAGEKTAQEALDAGAEALAEYDGKP